MRSQSTVRQVGTRLPTNMLTRMGGDWWDEGNIGIEQGLSHYEHHVSLRSEGDIDRAFDETNRSVGRRTPRFLTVDDLIVVMDFKNPPGRRQRAHDAAKSQSSEVERITREALDWVETDASRALKLLTTLKWVGVPTASAILAMVMPERFGVIDRLVMGEIGRLVADRLRVDHKSSVAMVTLADALTLWSEGDEAKAWAMYSEGLRQRADELTVASSPRTIEKALWGWAAERRDVAARK